MSTLTLQVSIQLKTSWILHASNQGLDTLFQYADFNMRMPRRVGITPPNRHRDRHNGSRIQCLVNGNERSISSQTVFQTVAHGVGLSDDVTTSFKTTVWEDNMGCLKLARLKPGQYTPRSKHYAVKYHWFRSHLSETTNRTSVQYVETTQQKADILTKGLTLDKFRQIRKLLCGW
mmetsp:Transcript_907/g.1790  ORF Transcript_907/g.1790 Transcript_907/m.1790 type:complete len:175 (+) Transcript_907:1174-1698(+)